MFAFVHIQKTAGQTLRQILRRHFGVRHCDIYRQYGNCEMGAAGRAWLRWCYPRLQSIGGHAVVPHADWVYELGDGLPRFFTFLREPAARVLSHYQFLVLRNSVSASFEDWARENANQQTRMLVGRDDLAAAIEVLETRVGFVGVVERFDESLLLLRDWLGIPQLDLACRPVNVAADNAIRDELRATPGCLSWVSDINHNDLALYDHVVENLYPAVVAAYPGRLHEELVEYRKACESPRGSAEPVISRIKRNVLFRPVFKRVTRPRQPFNRPETRSSRPSS